MRSSGSLLVLLGFPPFLYAAALLFSTLAGTDVVIVVLAFLVVAAVGAYAFFLPGLGTWVAAIVYLAIGVVILWVAFQPSGLGATGFDLALGGLAAGPIVSLLSFCHPNEGPGTRIVGVQVALLDGLLLLATHAGFGSGATGTTAQGLVGGYFTTIGQQAAGVFALLSLQGTVTAPVGTLFDPWYVALAAFPLLAILLTFLGPTTARGASLPTREGDPEGAEGEELELSPTFRTLLTARSASQAAPARRLPGFAALAAAGGVAIAYLAAAYLAPAYTLAVTSFGAIAAVAVLTILLRRPIGPVVEVADLSVPSGELTGTEFAAPTSPAAGPAR